MTTDIEALIADLRRDAHEPGVAPATALQAADVLESVTAERDRLRAEKAGLVEDRKLRAEIRAEKAEVERDVLRAIIDEALAEEERCTQSRTRMWRILSRATTTEKGTEA